jgi:hypothetical protein
MGTSLRHPFTALFVGVMVASLLAATSASPALAAAATASSVTGWQLQTTPTPGRAGYLWGVDCRAGNACQAVGGYSTATGITAPVTELWNGATWRVEPTPDAPGAYSAALYSVSCALVSSCVAVGSAEIGASHETLAEHWNGRSWSVVATPFIAGSALESVACPSISLCVAVGIKPGAQADVPLLDIWNGNSWHEGTLQVGRSWVNAGLYSVTCTSAIACIAAGMYQDPSYTTKTLVESWTGRSWAAVSTPNVPAQGDILQAIACSSARSCVAVGSTTTTAGQDSPISMSWNGSHWSFNAAQPQNTYGAAAAQALSCPASASCILVGDASLSNNQVSIAQAWNGSSWANQSTAGRSGANSLDSVSCGGGVCLAVGSAGGYTLAERYVAGASGQ